MDIVGTRPKLGRAQLGAVANFTNKFKESDEDNNFFKGEHFEVIARQWDVPYFDTIATVPGEGTRTTSSQSSFHFEFSSDDHSKALYVYLPMGSISSTMLYAGGLCSGTGSSTDSKAPWGGFLHIAGQFQLLRRARRYCLGHIYGAGQLPGLQQDGPRGVRRSGHDREAQTAIRARPSSSPQRDRRFVAVDPADRAAVICVAAIAGDTGRGAGRRRARRQTPSARRRTKEAASRFGPTRSTTRSGRRSRIPTSKPRGRIRWRPLS